MKACAKFEASLDYIRELQPRQGYKIRPCLKQNRQNKSKRANKQKPSGGGDVNISSKYHGRGSVKKNNK